MITTGSRKRGPSPSRPLAGFTLQELLLAVVILAILAVMAIPILRQISERSNSIRCTSNLRAWGHLISLYATDHKETFPLAFVELEEGGKISWNHINAPLARLYAPATPLNQWRRGDSINGCPEHDNTPYGSGGYTKRYYSYAINGHLSIETLANSYLKRINLKRPSNTILLADTSETGDPLCVFTAIKYNTYQFDTSLGKLHGGTVNALFVDNHIESLRTVTTDQIYP